MFVVLCLYERVFGNIVKFNNLLFWAEWWFGVSCNSAQHRSIVICSVSAFRHYYHLLSMNRASNAAQLGHMYSIYCGQCVIGLFGRQKVLSVQNRIGSSIELTVERIIHHQGWLWCSPTIWCRNNAIICHYVNANWSYKGRIGSHLKWQL